MSKTNTPPTATLSKDAYPFSPGLAAKLGLNEALVLSTIYDLPQESKIWKEGHYWVRHAIPVWHKYFFPFWSQKTVERTFSKLKDSGLLIVGIYNQKGYDKTIWYRIDYEELGELTKDLTPPRPPVTTSKVRVSDSGTGLTADFSPRNTPAPSNVASVDVGVGTQPGVPPEIPGTPTGIPDVPPNQEQPLPPTTTPEPDTVSVHEHDTTSPPLVELLILPDHTAKASDRRLVFVAVRDGWVYWSDDGVTVARSQKTPYLRALRGHEDARPHPLSPSNVVARLGDEIVVLHVPRPVDLALQRLIAKQHNWTWVARLGKWKLAKAGRASPRQTTAQP